jgi:hypothetical protein
VKTFYRKRPQERAWHFCSNCENWPEAAYEERDSLNPPPEFCPTCIQNQRQQGCLWARMDASRNRKIVQKKIRTCWGISQVATGRTTHAEKPLWFSRRIPFGSSLLYLHFHEPSIGSPSLLRNLSLSRSNDRRGDPSDYRGCITANIIAYE